MNCSLANIIRPRSIVTRLLVSRYSCLPEDQVTHTGQVVIGFDPKWDKDDYRMVRFINSPKNVNTNIAMKLIAEVPPKKVKSRIVSCDGGGGPTGHPQVFINLDKPGNHSCGYCGLRFELDHDH